MSPELERFFANEAQKDVEQAFEDEAIEQFNDIARDEIKRFGYSKVCQCCNNLFSTYNEAQECCFDDCSQLHAANL